MTYASRESSVQDGQPVELYTFVVAGTTHRLTSAEEDVTFGAQTYTATAGLGRGNATLVQVGKTRELTVTLARDHAIAAALLNNGIPPRTATVTIARYHRGDAESRQVWSGPISEAQVDGPYLRLSVPNSVDAAFDVRLPIAKVSRSCQHMLYGPGCGVDRNYPTYANHKHMSIADVVSATGTSLVVTALNDSLGAYRGDQWAQFGEVRRVTDGERRSILDQTGTTLTLDVPFGTLVAGDDLEIYAGCDHLVSTCRAKFNNVQKFGGHPYAPDNNPMAPQWIGISKGG